MPVIIELRLSAPGRDYSPTTVQLHGLACILFEGTSYDGHEGHEKPFSVWPLTSVQDGWLLRAAWLGPGFPQTVLAACGELRIGPVTCKVTDVALKPVSFGDLAATAVCGGARLEFRSPTYFSQNGERIVAPDIRLIAGSWRRRWNASVGTAGDLAIGDEEWRDIHHSLHLTEFALRTGKRDAGYSRQQTGFTGTATLRFAKDASSAACGRFGALARFAEFCGTGAQTTHGFGATAVTLLPGGAARQRGAAVVDRRAPEQASGSLHDLVRGYSTAASVGLGWRANGQVTDLSSYAGPVWDGWGSTLIGRRRLRRLRAPARRERRRRHPDDLLRVLLGRPCSRHWN